MLQADIASCIQTFLLRNFAMTNVPVMGRRYPVRLGRSLLNLPSDEAKQFICITERQKVLEDSDRVLQKGTISGRLGDLSISCQIRHDDGSTIEMQLKEKNGAPFPSHLLVFNDDVLYLEFVACEYTASKEDIKKLAKVHPQRLGYLMGKPQYNIVVAPQSVNTSEIRNMDTLDLSANADIPHGVSNTSSCCKVCR